MNVEAQGLFARGEDDSRYRFPRRRGPIPQVRIEETLVLIKPDAFERGLAGAVLERLERANLRIVGTASPTYRDLEKLLRKHYEEHRQEDFFVSLINFMQSGPVLALRVAGTRAISRVRSIMGSADGTGVGTIRGDFGVDGPRTLVHASDSPEAAEREREIWFPGV